MPLAFILKKVVTFFLLPPGCLVIALVVTAVLTRKKLKVWLFILAGFIYLMSIQPAADLLMKPLENAYKPASPEEIRSCDAYVVLGGGINETAPDVNGRGILSSDALPRFVTAYRLYKMEPKPIIVSGGKVGTKAAEADIGAGFLISLGVPEKDIIREPRSLDTEENALFTKEAAEKAGLKKIVLITSAFHMKRAFFLFGKYFKDIEPYPCGHLTTGNGYGVSSFLPGGDGFSVAAKALKEDIGMTYYRFFRK